MVGRNLLVLLEVIGAVRHLPCACRIGAPGAWRPPMPVEEEMLPAGLVSDVLSSWSVILPGGVVGSVPAERTWKRMWLLA